ncbi:MAG: NAD(P)/FAD-dependent oxidoreductase [Acidimicrobiales bacterium]
MNLRPHVVAIGAGFAGLSVARGLARQPVDVTLIDRHNFTTFQPLLYQVATSGLNAADVAYPVRGLLHRQANVRFRHGEVVGVDWDARELHVEAAAGSPSIPFDHLVVAAGARTSWFDVTGAHRWARPLYTLDDAVNLRNHIVGRFEAADADPSLIDDGALTFVVVGGGPTGVEMAGALAELVAVVFRRDFPRLDVDRARIVLLEARDTLLPPFRPASQRHALKTLRARQVEVRLDDSVAEVGERDVRLSDGELVQAHTVVWAAGVRANPLAEVLGLATTRGGRIVVGDDLTVPDRPGVWAVGDVAAATARRGGDTLPQLAPVAMQSGAHVARQIGRQLSGRPTRPFRFHDKGTMATIGRRAAVAELPGGITLRGTLAWLAWLGLHIFYLAGLRNRASVMLNWAWGYLTWDRGPRLILRQPALDRPADGAGGRPSGSADGSVSRPDGPSDNVPAHG